jgi:ribosomal protein S18 acetylase RimI-like enzyme
MIIRLAIKNDAGQIADIHRKEIINGFLSGLGDKFLEKIYSALIEFDMSFCVVAEEGGRVIGFIAGTVELNGFYYYFLLKYFLTSIFFLMPQIFKFQKIKKIVEVLFYPKKEKGMPGAELLTMAIRNEFQGQGIAGRMLEKFIFEMKSKGVGSFKVVVGGNLAPAIKFYEKSGFRFVRNINIHGEEPSRIYVYGGLNT